MNILRMMKCGADSVLDGVIPGNYGKRLPPGEFSREIIGV
jgi:hypothetical protein